MPNWFRVVAFAILALSVVALLGVVGAGAVIGDQYADDVQGAAHERPREIFWFLLFTVVMATSLLAAVRRLADHALQAVASKRRR
jgi:hypothetical protein